MRSGQRSLQLFVEPAPSEAVEAGGRWNFVDHATGLLAKDLTSRKIQAGHRRLQVQEDWLPQAVLRMLQLRQAML